LLNIAFIFLTKSPKYIHTYKLATKIIITVKNPKISAFTSFLLHNVQKGSNFLLYTNQEFPGKSAMLVTIASIKTKRLTPMIRTILCQSTPFIVFGLMKKTQ
jgi:hypothetical protein